MIETNLYFKLVSTLFLNMSIVIQRPLRNQKGFRLSLNISILIKRPKFVSICIPKYFPSAACSKDVGNILLFQTFHDISKRIVIVYPYFQLTLDYALGYEFALQLTVFSERLMNHPFLLIFLKVYIDRNWTRFHPMLWIIVYNLA